MRLKEMNETEVRTHTHTHTCLQSSPTLKIAACQQIFCASSSLPASSSESDRHSKPTQTHHKTFKSVTIHVWQSFQDELEQSQTTTGEPQTIHTGDKIDIDWYFNHRCWEKFCSTALRSTCCLTFTRTWCREASYLLSPAHSLHSASP